ncbi:lmo0937 family membrane protein [Bacillus solitudinis]|nr:lmo0937 family membrane protein [Bacillus solitudinis]
MWALLIILLVLWLLGFGFEVGGNLIHILLVIALIVLIFRLVTGRRA